MPEADGKQRKTRQSAQVPARDLIDFYRRWGEFRDSATALSQRAELPPDERETLRWMILLVDRIGEQDVGPVDRS
ncbi:hypothetical protein ACQR16_10185 [Bradyrhizobium oligotrophicum]|uniref:hypothetical protein n=1 Tax=Bradyrhizobium oligotrophicum TaxID=44255 RepID=UPI003EBE83B2